VSKNVEVRIDNCREWGQSKAAVNCSGLIQPRKEDGVLDRAARKAGNRCLEPTEGESVVPAAQFRESRRESPRSGGSPFRAKPEGRRPGVERAQIPGGATQALHARS
jgi:hypothetical protein